MIRRLIAALLIAVLGMPIAASGSCCAPERGTRSEALRTASCCTQTGCAMQQQLCMVEQQDQLRIGIVDTLGADTTQRFTPSLPASFSSDVLLPAPPLQGSPPLDSQQFLQFTYAITLPLRL